MVIYGHPGHELLLFHTLASFEAEINCFTDGSGGRMMDRTRWTRDVIRKFGGSVGPVFGEATDKNIYADILSGRTEAVVGWTRKLIEQAMRFVPQFVITDPFEYFNPVHDLANSVADIVIVELQRQGHRCTKLIYPNDVPNALRPEDAWRRRELSDDEIREKLSAVLAYEPLREEFERLTAEQKTGALRCEMLFNDPIRMDNVPDACDTIYQEVSYERIGRERINRGDYEQLLTFDRHYRPFVSQLTRQFCRVAA